MKATAIYQNAGHRVPTLVQVLGTSPSGRIWIQLPGGAQRRVKPTSLRRVERPKPVQPLAAAPTPQALATDRYGAEEQGRSATIARGRSIFWLASRYVQGGIEWRYQDTAQSAGEWEVREQVLKNGARWESCPVAHPSVGARPASLYNAPRRLA